MSRIGTVVGEAVSRPEVVFTGLDLSTATTRARFSVKRGQGVTLYVRREFGTWSTATLTIKRAAEGDSYASDFATAKTIGAGGGSVRISAAEMVGVDELEIAVATGEGSSATAVGSLVTEEREVVVAGSGSDAAAADIEVMSGGDASTTSWDFFMDGGDASSVYAPYQWISGGEA